jgi:hypothetical protein
MSNDAQAGSNLQDFIVSLADGQTLDEPVHLLQWAARYLALMTSTQAQWAEAQSALERLTAGKGADRILARQKTVVSAVASAPGWKVVRPTASEMAQAEADFRSHLPQIAEQRSEIEQVAGTIKSDVETCHVIECITEIIKHKSCSRLSPFALLVVLWWFLALTPANDASPDMTVLALWYSIAPDARKIARGSWKKD